MTRNDPAGSTANDYENGPSPDVADDAFATVGDVVRSSGASVAVASLGAGLGLLGGLRSLVRGRYLRGFGQVGLGVALAWFVLSRRRGAEEPGVGETGRTIEIADVTSTGTAGRDRATEEMSEAGGPEAVSESVRRPEPEPGQYRELGRAAYDEYSHDVPVPQQALDLELLALGTEAFWGVREDDAVLVSQLYDPIQEADGVRYVGSSEVDEDRMLSVPDVVTDHWDRVAGGGQAVESGTDLAFLTSDDLQADDQVLVVPDPWVDAFAME